MDPTAQCDLQPLLDPGAPAARAATAVHRDACSREDFEDGLAGWTTEQEVVFAGG